MFQHHHHHHYYHHHDEPSCPRHGDAMLVRGEGGCAPPLGMHVSPAPSLVSRDSAALGHAHGTCRQGSRARDRGETSCKGSAQSWWARSNLT